MRHSLSNWALACEDCLFQGETSQDRSASNADDGRHVGASRALLVVHFTVVRRPVCGKVATAPSRYREQ